MNRGAIALAAVAPGCGDNLDDPPALQPADTLVVVAHFDDDTIWTSAAATTARCAPGAGSHARRAPH